MDFEGIKKLFRVNGLMAITKVGYKFIRPFHFKLEVNWLVFIIKSINTLQFIKITQTNSIKSIKKCIYTNFTSPFNNQRLIIQNKFLCHFVLSSKQNYWNSIPLKFQLLTYTNNLTFINTFMTGTNFMA